MFFSATEPAFHGRQPEGERALWALVLSSAIQDLGARSDGGLLQNRHERSQGSVRQQRRALALQWITAADDTNIGSFDFVCAAIDLDASACRERIIRADQQRFAKKPITQTITAPPAASPVMNGSIPNVTNPMVRETKGPSSVNVEAPKQRKRGEHMGNGNGQGHIDWLKSQATRFEQQLAAAEATCLRLKPVVANIQSVITALADPADKIVTAAADPDINGTNGAAKLKRQPPYADIGMIDALKQILVDGQPVHQDELVRQVFQIGDEAEFQRARPTVIARLSVGSKAGLFRALGNGRFMIHNGAMQG